LLLLLIQINLKSLISEFSELPAKELASVLASCAPAAKSSPPRNGGNTSSSNPLTFTLDVVTF
jgi:hypothetical protein